MKKILITIIGLLIGSHCLYSQNMPDFPKDSKSSKGYVHCLNKDGTWVSVYKNPSLKTVKNIQIRLAYLGYPVVKTWVYDQQTKQVLKQFNKDHGLKTYPAILEGTLKKLKKAYRNKRKQRE